MGIHNRRNLTPEERVLRSAYYKKWRDEHPTECKGYRVTYRAKAPEAVIYRTVRGRAKQLGIAFNLTREDIVIPDVCPVLGIPMLKGIGKMQESSPSVDRHIPALGYTKGNIQIMSMRANRIKNDGTAEEHEKIAKYMRNFSEQQQ